MDAYAHVRQHFLVHQSIDIPLIYLCCEYELICTFHSRVMGLLLRSSVSDGRPSCNRTVYLLRSSVTTEDLVIVLFIFIIFSFPLSFLRDGLVDFLETFRD